MSLPLSYDMTQSVMSQSIQPEIEALRLVREVLAQAVGLAVGSVLPHPASKAVSPGAHAALPPAQLFTALSQVVMGPQADLALQFLQEAGLLAALLPELEATVDLGQEMGRRHKDVWKHTKQVVIQAPPELAIRWAALLHDVGKVETRVIMPDGKVAFHGHAEVGARLFDRIARRLDFPQPLRGQVRFLIYNHLRANQYEGGWTDSAVRRFAKEMGEHLEALLKLSRADLTSGRRQRREQVLRQLDELADRIQVIQEQDSHLPPLPSGLGNAVIERFSLRPGPLIGQLRQRLEQAVEQNELEPFREAEYYLNYLAEHQDW